MKTALYRHYDAEGKCLYIGISGFPLRRTDQHVQESPWFGSVVRIELEWHEDRPSASRAEKIAIREERPKFNRSGVSGIREICDFLSDASLTQERFAELLGISQGMLSKLCTGRTKPSLSLAIKIERETGGLVPASIWIGHSAEDAA